MQRFKKIKLTQGKYALVDAEDFEWLSQWKWYLGKYIHIGTFKTKLLAHRAYIKKAEELHGGFARWK